MSQSSHSPWSSIGGSAHRFSAAQRARWIPQSARAQGRINNVAGVANAAGPALLGAARFDNFLFFTHKCNVPPRIAYRYHPAPDHVDGPRTFIDRGDAPDVLWAPLQMCYGPRSRYATGPAPDMLRAPLQMCYGPYTRYAMGLAPDVLRAPLQICYGPRTRCATGPATDMLWAQLQMCYRPRYRYAMGPATDMLRAPLQMCYVPKLIEINSPGSCLNHRRFGDHAASTEIKHVQRSGRRLRSCDFPHNFRFPAYQFCQPTTTKFQNFSLYLMI